MKNKIKAILIDDELSARENLSYLLENFCPEITLLDSCSSVDEGVLSIKANKPDVVFLDIEMPQKNGFQLIKYFENIDFQIVFITAYDQYAIKAFEVSALDYLLKPIDIDRLVELVPKLNNQLLFSNFQERVDVLSENKKELTRISIPYKSDYAILNISNIVCVEADRMYANIYTSNDKKYMVSKSLSYYEDLLMGGGKFKRVHRSWLVNLESIESYSKTSKKLLLNSGAYVPVSKKYKEEIERFLGF